MFCFFFSLKLSTSSVRSPESPLQHSRQSLTSVSMETHDGPHGAVNRGQSSAFHRRGQPTRKISQVAHPTDDIRLTIKASKIQRDMDVLNHTLEDLDDFLNEVRGCAQAFKEYETRKKRAKKDGEGLGGVVWDGEGLGGVGRGCVGW